MRTIIYTRGVDGLLQRKIDLIDRKLKFNFPFRFFNFPRKLVKQSILDFSGNEAREIPLSVALVLSHVTYLMYSGSVFSGILNDRLDSGVRVSTRFRFSYICFECF